MKKLLLLGLFLLVSMSVASASYVYEWNHGGVKAHNPTHTYQTYTLQTWNYINHNDYNRAVMDFYDELDSIIDSNEKLYEYKNKRIDHHSYNNKRYYDNSIKRSYHTKHYREYHPQPYRGGFSKEYKYNYREQRRKDNYPTKYYWDSHGKYKVQNGIKVYN